MDHVTAVGFSSCALQHNAKLPNLALPAGLPIDAKHAQASTTRSRPSTGDTFTAATRSDWWHVMCGISGDAQKIWGYGSMWWYV